MIMIPSAGGHNWQRFLADPEKHWVPGYSAMTAAASWEAAAGSLPPEIGNCLDASKAPALVHLELLIAVPEWQVELPGGNTNSQTDVMAFCRNSAGLVVMAVEAKSREDFAGFVGEKRNGSVGQVARLKYLEDLLGVPRFGDDIRYQLLHLTASAILTARQFHAPTAVMLLHAFESPADTRADFNKFAKQLHGMTLTPRLFEIPRQDGLALYLAWCEGDSKFLKADVRMKS